jgi:hypothetical protein
MPCPSTERVVFGHLLPQSADLGADVIHLLAELRAQLRKLAAVFSLDLRDTQQNLVEGALPITWKLAAAERLRGGDQAISARG